MEIKVHGKNLSDNIYAALQVANICLDGEMLKCNADKSELRDNAISLLNSYGFKVSSSYQQGTGWTVNTVGVEK